MKSFLRQFPPYEGTEPYIYLAFSGKDSRKVKKILRLLYERGCRVWYFCGKANSSKEQIERQRRASGASLVLLYLSDAAVSDLPTKANVLICQNLNTPIVCLDPDGKDRKLSMGLKEGIPEVRLDMQRGRKETENAILHAEGFSQELLDAVPPVMHQNGWLTALPVVLIVAALLLIGVFVYRTWFAVPKEEEAPIEEVSFSDPLISSAVKNALPGKPLTEENIREITVLSLDGMPSSWDDLLKLPSLETVEIPQYALIGDVTLPDGAYAIRLKGGTK